jgi:hypothetical protein
VYEFEASPAKEKKSKRVDRGLDEDDEQEDEPEPANQGLADTTEAAAEDMPSMTAPTGARLLLAARGGWLLWRPDEQGTALQC